MLPRLSFSNEPLVTEAISTYSFDSKASRTAAPAASALGLHRPSLQLWQLAAGSCCAGPRTPPPQKKTWRCAHTTPPLRAQGLIYEHQLDRIIPPEAPLAQLLEWLAARLQPGGAQPIPQGLPGVPGLRLDR
jgi:hypothetical protein